MTERAEMQVCRDPGDSRVVRLPFAGVYVGSKKLPGPSG